jgi:hypothetical protein
MMPYAESVNLDDAFLDKVKDIAVVSKENMDRNDEEQKQNSSSNDNNENSDNDDDLSERTIGEIIDRKDTNKIKIKEVVSKEKQELDQKLELEDQER